MKTSTLERVDQTGESANRLARLTALDEGMTPEVEFLVKREMSILWRRSLGTWLRMKWPRAMGALDGITGALKRGPKGDYFE